MVKVKKMFKKVRYVSLYLTQVNSKEILKTSAYYQRSIKIVKTKQRNTSVQTMIIFKIKLIQLQYYPRSGSSYAGHHETLESAGE